MKLKDNSYDYCWRISELKETKRSCKFLFLFCWDSEKFDQIWCNLKEIDVHGEILVWSETSRKNLKIEWNWKWFFCIFWDYQTFRHFWWKLGLNLMKVSKKIACISLVEILKLVRISLKKKLISCLHTTYFIYDSHFTTTSLGHCTQKVCTYTANMCSEITVEVQLKNCTFEKLQFFTVDHSSLYFLQVKNCNFIIIFNVVYFAWN